MKDSAGSVPLLRAKVRAILEKGVKEGVPPVAVGMSLCIPAKVMFTWMQCGMAGLEKAPEEPEDDEVPLAFSGERYVKAGDWYVHQLECMRLARVVCRCEGLLVGGLVKRMWDASKKNPDMMKFLFRSYEHAHGIVSSGIDVKVSSQNTGEEAHGGITRGGLQLYLPHNGREEPSAPIVAKPSKK